MDSIMDIGSVRTRTRTRTVVITSSDKGRVSRKRLHAGCTAFNAFRILSAPKLLGVDDIKWHFSWLWTG